MSIDALLAALKNHESGQATMGPMAPVQKSTATKSGFNSDMGASDGNEEDGPSAPEDSTDPAQNAAIVEALQTEYPDIYKKILSEVSGGDETDEASGNDDEQMEPPEDMMG